MCADGFRRGYTLGPAPLAVTPRRHPGEVPEDDVPIGPMPVHPDVPAAIDIDDPRADLRLERRLDSAVRSTQGSGVGTHVRPYVERRLAEVLADIEAIDAEVAALGARRRTAGRLARRYRELLQPRAAELRRQRRVPLWYAIDRPHPGPEIELLAGSALRDAVVEVVIDADDAMTVAEVRAALVHRGFDAAPKGRGTSPVNKAVADALAAAIATRRLERRERGVYQPAGGPRRPVPTANAAIWAMQRRMRTQPHSA
jgi:hypothetical protein